MPSSSSSSSRPGRTRGQCDEQQQHCSIAALQALCGLHATYLFMQKNKHHPNKRTFPSPNPPPCFPPYKLGWGANSPYKFGWGTNIHMDYAVSRFSTAQNVPI